MSDKSRIIAVDFDGTLCSNKYPSIGKANKELFEYLIKAKKYGAKIILWTNRTGDLLEKAIAFCNENGLIFDAVNSNLPEIIEEFGGDTRKIFANEYIDDRNSIGWRYSRFKKKVVHFGLEPKDKRNEKKRREE